MRTTSIRRVHWSLDWFLKDAREGVENIPITVLFLLVGVQLLSQIEIAIPSKNHTP